MKRVVEAGEVERPARLSAIEILGSLEVLQVLVVCPDLYRVPRSLQVVTPFLQTTNNCKQFLVMDLVVAFRGIERLGKECNWVLLVGVCVELEQDTTSSEVRAV